MSSLYAYNIGRFKCNQINQLNIFKNEPIVSAALGRSGRPSVDLILLVVLMTAQTSIPPLDRERLLVRFAGSERKGEHEKWKRLLAEDKDALFAK